MKPVLILYPVFVLLGLTLVVALRMLQLRIRSVRRGDLKARYFEFNRDGIPPAYLAKVEQNFSNLLEIPVLFYIAAITLVALNQLTLSQLVLAWSFVATRFIHTLIHTTHNRILWRLLSFLAGFILLVSLWISIVVQVMQL